jgi:hypothetical protein
MSRKSRSPLGFDFADKKIDARRIAAGPSKIGDKTKPDRVFTDDKSAALAAKAATTTIPIVAPNVDGCIARCA